MKTRELFTVMLQIIQEIKKSEERWKRKILVTKT